MNTTPLHDPDGDQDAGVQVTLGLHREPFPPEAGADKGFFYAEQTRAQRLKLLHHLAPYGELLIVTGDPGSGKTTLLDQFIERAHDSWRLCVIRARAELDRDELLDALMDGFSVQAKQPEGDDDRLQLLKSHCVALKRKGLLPMVVIDDAHKLDRDALAALMQLLQVLDAHEKPLRIILFADPHLRELISVPELEALQERISHTFNLPPFSEKETGNYIQHRLKASGVDAAGVFTDTVVAMIHKTSQGLPGKINELARVVLSNQGAGGAVMAGMTGTKEGRQGKGGKNVVLVGLVLAALILGALYALHRPSPPKGVSVEDQVARIGHQESVPLPLPSNATPGGETPPPFSHHTPAPPPTSMTVPEGGAPANGPSGEVAESSAPPAPASAVAPQPQGVPAAPAEQAPLPHAATPGVGASPAPRTAPAAPAVPHQAKRGPTHPPAGKPAAGGKVKDAAWVLDQDPKHFTMQLMATQAPATVQRFVQRHPADSGKFAQFQTESRDKTWHVLVYGQFTSRTEAEARAKRLPPGLHGVKPWIRPFKDVQAGIRRYRHAHPPSRGM